MREQPDRTWLRDRQGDDFTEWNWREANHDMQAVAAWLESQFGSDGTRIAIISRNCAHWMLADLAITASGNVSVPIFTTQSAESAHYILEFSEVSVLFIGSSENWDQVREVVPDHVQLVALPGTELSQQHVQWDDIVAAHAGGRTHYTCRHDDLMSLVFTSGTTGAPKGVMQTHDSMLIPMERAARAFQMRKHPRFLSYLPLAHVAERQLVWIQSLIHCGTVTFNESLTTLVRDMGETRPTYFFGAPRVWEQLQQGILARFGSQSVLDQALAQDAAGVGLKIRTLLGLTDTDCLLTAAAPIPAALIRWYEKLGIILMEGYGQTEAMGLICNMEGQRRIGSIGRPIEGTEIKISDSGELLCKADGLSPGYYRQPEKTAETFVDGWVHTGDKARIDEDGFCFLTGRVKDYFKTIHGKYVAPAPIENVFARNQWVEQLCLLGRGYSKTVMVCVPTEIALQENREKIGASLRAQAEAVNDSIESHARIGAVLISSQPWTIENGTLTPTLKLKRDMIESLFGERAGALAHEAAIDKAILIEWAD
ncbi:MAG: AMP-binding protein [Xanthomonadales bacterium]|nr:AMP-binding protein [Xanthomonadales bacterium]MDH3924060.1 AMP-binding protein [Xanthomonadales bacterium]MDH3939589.1 AMP-binding protein [Xanthomonadales bacterium]MDH4000995.1 AMP-binding protein [Xanthomonadales bacterium]